MKKLALLFLSLFMFFTITSCGNNSNNNSNPSNNNTNSNTDNGGGNSNTDNGGGNNSESSSVSVKTVDGALKQENKADSINIALNNENETIKLDKIFSYGAEYMIDIHSDDSSANNTSKELSLNIGYNNFQILFKNLSDYSEKTYNLKIFRDPGTTTRKVTQYSVKKEITESLQNNGLPSYKFKFYYPYDENITLNGQAIPAEITECNIQIQYVAYFYIDSENYIPSDYFPHKSTRTLQIDYSFNSAKDVYETKVDFPLDFWNEYCSSYPFSTLDNTSRGIYERNSNGLFVYTGSSIKLKVDYSKFQFN